MLILDLALVFGVLAVLVYVALRLLPGPGGQQHHASVSGRWQAAHYDVKGQTRVVLRKLSAGGTHVLDEHVIAVIRADDPEYDEKFLVAMSTARERQALFESEE